MLISFSTNPAHAAKSTSSCFNASGITVADWLKTLPSINSTEEHENHQNQQCRAEGHSFIGVVV